MTAEKDPPRHVRPRNLRAAAANPKERGSRARSAEEKSDTQRATKSDDSSRAAAVSRARMTLRTRPISQPTKAIRRTLPRSLPETPASKRIAKRVTPQAPRIRKRLRATRPRLIAPSVSTLRAISARGSRLLCAAKATSSAAPASTSRIAVGTRLPRDWDFVPVPDDVVVIVPEYRGYYFAYVDDQYVICDPDTYEVVAVIPAERSYAGGSSGGGSKCSSQLSLNADDRELILRSVSRGREVDIADLSVGRKVPRDVELLSFPESVVSEASELGSCRYFDAGDQIAIVDPDEDKIVLIIDKS